MAKRPVHVSETPATQWLRRHGITFSEHVYDYVEHGGTAESARQIGIDEHAVVKTLAMQDERAQPLIVLMHGERQVSTKALARAIGCKSVEACSAEAAQRASGYQLGGTSPFGFRRSAPPRSNARCDGGGRVNCLPHQSSGKQQWRGPGAWRRCWRAT